MSLKRFFAYSIAVHTLIIVAVMFFMPVVKEKKTGGELFTRLVSPDEFLANAPFIPAIPEVKSVLPVKPGKLMPGPLTERNVPKIDRDVSPVPEQDVSTPRYSSAPTESIQGKESRPENKGDVQKPVPMPTIREKIFDKGIISDIAKRGFKEDKEEAEKTFTSDIKELRYLGYLRRLKEKIEGIWIYPPDAAARGIYGDLVIKFTIKKNGRLGAVELIRTSGHKSLDDAAMKALRDAEPYWPLPDEWGMEAYTIEGRFLYTIYGYYIR